MRVFKVRSFHRFAKSHGLQDARLIDAVREIGHGRIDADLGGGIYKQRVARPGAGRSGGFRVVIAHRLGAHWFFVFGFEKSKLDNVNRSDLQVLRQHGLLLSGYSSDELAWAIEKGELVEVRCGEED